MAWLVVNKDSEYGLVFDKKPQRIGCHWDYKTCWKANVLGRWTSRNLKLWMKN